MVELAIVIPVLVLFLLVIADFARIFFVSVAVNNAARAGAQFGSESVNNASNASWMEQAASADFGCVPSGKVTCPNFPNWQTPTASQCTCVSPPVITACPTAYCKNTTQANYVTVNTSATYSTILNYPGIQKSYTLTGQAIMQVQANQ